MKRHLKDYVRTGKIKLTVANVRSVKFDISIQFLDSLEKIENIILITPTCHSQYYKLSEMK